jgi:hypothetical protein
VYSVGSLTVQPTRARFATTDGDHGTQTIEHTIRLPACGRVVTLRGHAATPAQATPVIVGLASPCADDCSFGGLLLVAAGCGDNAHHYTKAATDKSLSQLGTVATPAQYGGVLSGSASLCAVRTRER